MKTLLTALTFFSPSITTQNAYSYTGNSVERSCIEGERNVQGYIHAYLTLCEY